jgi:hypothetical protein
MLGLSCPEYPSQAREVARETEIDIEDVIVAMRCLPLATRSLSQLPLSRSSSYSQVGSTHTTAASVALPKDDEFVVNANAQLLKFLSISVLNGHSISSDLNLCCLHVLAALTFKDPSHFVRLSCD